MIVIRDMHVFDQSELLRHQGKQKATSRSEFAVLLAGEQRLKLSRIKGCLYVAMTREDLVSLGIDLV